MLLGATVWNRRRAQGERKKREKAHALVPPRTCIFILSFTWEPSTSALHVRNTNEGQNGLALCPHPLTPSTSHQLSLATAGVVNVQELPEVPDGLDSERPVR